jgi:hypothetical protein
MLSEDEGGGVIDSYTKFLLHLNNNVTDSSLSPKTFTNSGVTFSNGVGEYKFGYSGIFTGGGVSRITTPAHSDFNLGSSNWTIDFWVKFDTHSESAAFVSHASDVNNDWRCVWSSASGLNFIVFESSSATQRFHATWTPADDTWYHIEFVRSGSTPYIFVDGVSQSVTIDTALGTIPSQTDTLKIGYDPNFLNEVDGKMDEVRLSVGIARWTSAFTPPGNEYGISLKDYTVDLWIDPLSLSDANAYIIGQDDAWKLTLDGTSNKYLKFSIVGGSSVIAPISLSLETWQHVAVVQSNGTIKIYVDGVLGGSIAGEVMVNGTEDLTIGADSNGEHLFDGFIEEVRISDNARWTAAFSTPDEAYESDENTKLLLPLNVQTVPNMVLQSVGYVSNYVPTSARVVIFEEDIDVMEQNVDLKVEVSRDGGTTFTTCLIAKDQEFGDGTLNLFSGSVDLQGQPNGELLVWRLTTQNNKDCRIRGVSLSWR